MPPAKTKTRASTPRTTPRSKRDPIADLFAEAGEAPPPPAPTPAASQLEGVPAELAEQARRSGLTPQQTAGALALALGLSMVEASRVSGIGLSQLRWMKSANMAFKAFLDRLTLSLQSSLQAEAMREVQRQLTDSVDKQSTGADIYKWVDLALRTASPVGAPLGVRQQLVQGTGLNPAAIPVALGGTNTATPAMQVQEACDVSSAAIKRLDPARRRKLVEFLGGPGSDGEGVGEVRA